MRILYAGYRGWSISIFRKLHAALPKHSIDLVLSPDELKGMVKGAANGRVYSLLLAYGWSWKIPKETIEQIPCWCLHPSPLPKYRGGSPLQHQIINGEKVSAVSIFRMVEDLDAGPLLAQIPFPLDGTLEKIFDLIVMIAASWTAAAIQDMDRGSSPKEWEQEGEPTYFKRRTPEQSRIETTELTDTAERLHNKIRALAYEEYPPAFLQYEDGSRLEILKTRIAKPKEVK